MDLIERIVELIERERSFCLATVVRSDKPGVAVGAKAIFFPDGRVEGHGLEAIEERLTPLAVEALGREGPTSVDLEEGLRVFLDVHAFEARLLICGAGHIAVPLSLFAREADFSVTVLDDRPDYAAQDRFPGCRVVAEDFVSALRGLSPAGFPYVAVITRGHAHDLECLAEVLGWETEYVGLIGSRRRVRLVMEELGRIGFPERALQERLFTPIGLEIGAVTPEEIAISIGAELVCVRRGGGARTRALREAGWGTP